MTMATHNKAWITLHPEAFKLAQAMAEDRKSSTEIQRTLNEQFGLELSAWTIRTYVKTNPKKHRALPIRNPEAYKDALKWYEEGLSIRATAVKLWQVHREHLHPNTLSQLLPTRTNGKSWADNNPVAYQSAIDWRKAGWTYPKIADALGQMYDIKISDTRVSAALQGCVEDVDEGGDRIYHAKNRKGFPQSEEETAHLNAVNPLLQAQWGPCTKNDDAFADWLEEVTA
jgi:hypothetical protein